MLTFFNAVLYTLAQRNYSYISKLSLIKVWFLLIFTFETLSCAAVFLTFVYQILQEFLMKILVAFKGLLSQEVFPSDWFVLRIVSNKYEPYRFEIDFVIVSKEFR